MYNRLFTKILDSSIWLEADTTRIVWITLLAAMDEDGYAPFSSMENLSRRANVPLSATVAAVTVLESPDKFNMDQEYEGRRIERVEGGWLVLKAPYYRTLLSREIAREQTRIRVAKYRDKRKGVTNPALPDVTSVTETNVTHSEQSKAKHNKAEAIYCAYPRKKKKPEALKAIQKALLHIDFDTLLARTEAFARARPSPTDRFTPHPATWFNNEGYNDDPSTWPDGENIAPAKPKEKAPTYPRYDPPREPTNEEKERARDAMRLHVGKLKTQMKMP